MAGILDSSMTDTTPTTDPLDGVRERPGGRSARIRASVLEATRIELVTSGYAAFSYRAVAQRAGVDPATVYRRWPSRARLVADSLLALAGESVTLPDTGSIETDLETHLDRVLVALTDERWLRLYRAFTAASSELDEASDSVRTFWTTRFEGAQVLVTRAIARGELPEDTDPNVVIESLIAPAFFRVLVSIQPIDDGFVQRCARAVLAAARER
jgi:AcrR family transcriptional regulator